MSEYVPRPGYSYREYLQSKSFVNDIRWDISQTAVKLGGSLETLRAQGARVEEGIATAAETTNAALRETALETQQTMREEASRTRETMSEGFLILHFDLEKVSTSLRDMTALFHYGFGQLNTQLGAVNDTLEELRRLAKNPEQTWAFEQYQIARDAFQQGLYEEAVTYVTRAIEGHHTHTGYVLEHRFHYLLGVLRLGDFLNNAAETFELGAAEKAFLHAARYARVNYPHDAARALCSAGYAAYAENRMETALEHTRAAIVLYPELPQAHFQFAKFLFHLDRPDDALPELRRAIMLEPLYSVKWSTDPDFNRFEVGIAGLLQEMTAELRALAASKAKELIGYSALRLEALAQCKHVVAGLDCPGAVTLVPSDATFATVHTSADQLAAALSTLSAYMDVLEKLRQAHSVGRAFENANNLTVLWLKEIVDDAHKYATTTDLLTGEAQHQRAPTGKLWPGFKKAKIRDIESKGSAVRIGGAVLGLFGLVTTFYAESSFQGPLAVAMLGGIVLFVFGGRVRDGAAAKAVYRDKLAFRTAEREFHRRKTLVRPYLDRIRPAFLPGFDAALRPEGGRRNLVGMSRQGQRDEYWKLEERQKEIASARTALEAEQKANTSMGADQARLFTERLATLRAQADVAREEQKFLFNILFPRLPP